MVIHDSDEDPGQISRCGSLAEYHTLRQDGADVFHLRGQKLVLPVVRRTLPDFVLIAFVLMPMDFRVSPRVQADFGGPGSCVPSLPVRSIMCA
jgi:hypothetical protein